MDTTLAGPPAGQLLDGRYRVASSIAHGGMATVYLGVDTRLDRTVAIKIMHAELAADEDFVARFIREARSVAQLSHPNVVAVFDQGSDGRHLYLAMEYVPGRTLRQLLNERGQLSPRESLDIIESVLAGLAAAHQAGIVHRDVKPENVLLAEDGRVKVADFGLARSMSGTSHTKTGVLMGTVAYLAPEQVTANVSDARCDVYAAGVMLFELLTGSQPHTGESALAVAYKHVNETVPAPSGLVPGLPQALDALVALSTSRDPDLRPGDAGQFLGAVRGVRSGQPVPLPPSAQLPPATPGRHTAPLPPGMQPGMQQPPGVLQAPGGPRRAYGAAPLPGQAFGAAGYESQPPGAAGSPGQAPGAAGFGGEAPGAAGYEGQPPAGYAGQPPGAAGYAGQPPGGAGYEGRDSGAAGYADQAPGAAGSPGQALGLGGFPGQAADAAGFRGQGRGAHRLSGAQQQPGGSPAPAPVGGDLLPWAAAAPQWDDGFGRAGPAAQPAGAMYGPAHQTLVVSRDAGGGGGPREPWLQQWLFSRRLAYLVLAVIAVGLIAVVAWWQLAGRYMRVPQVTHLSVAAARAQLRSLGFTVRTGPARLDNGLTKGQVMATLPAAGARVNKGSTVELIPSAGPRVIAVPQVTGQPLAGAQATLRRAGLTPGKVVSQVSGTIPAGIVISTGPAAGASQPQPQPVTITVSAGPPLPDFTGQQKAVAEQWAQQNGVSLNEQPGRSSSQPQGTIIRQSPAANTPVSKGEVVTVYISPGPPSVQIPNVDGEGVLQAYHQLQRLGFQVTTQMAGPFGKTVFSYSPSGQAPKGSTITISYGLPYLGGGGG